jgi:hypothetical protein
MNIETPVYQVVAEKSGYEIRQYDEYLVAETVVAGDYEAALGDGFRIIADYIFGNNTATASIAMTAPVLEERSEKIAMTVPVLAAESETKQRVIAFVLPAQYTLATLPLPNNPAVSLRVVPAHTVAVRRFTWYATEKRIANETAQLEASLLRDGVAVVGVPQVAQYNPPLSFPLTRRNEIIIPITMPTSE